MDDLIECVPNVSTAEDVATLAQIERVVAVTPGVWLLDRSSDVDHARSVLTMAGTARGVREAMIAMISLALAEIDLREQRGVHPRIGAVDVVPFVPLAQTPMSVCVDLARTFGSQVAEDFELPVFLYGEAAQQPSRQRLANIRRGGYEGLADAMARPQGEPDFGPTRPHPSAGAIAIGARPLLVAYNIQLGTDDVELARRIARGIRESDGGLLGVQALGLPLRVRGGVQVSMNILSFETTPLWRVWEAVSDAAAPSGVEVVDSELIGLVPAAAMDDVAARIGIDEGADTERRYDEAGAWLRIRDFRPDMVLEQRLAKARTDASAGVY